MGSVSSEEDSQQSQRFESYSLSADVSESDDRSSSFSDDFPATWPEFDSISDLPVPITIMLPVVGGGHVLTPPDIPEKPETKELSDVELMKERFAKLLLGEDMSGGGNGVCPALAISNAITNLYATVFGELWKLEPLAPQKRSMWLREMQWLVSISDPIVELIPSLQQFPGGGTFEVMVTRPRADLYVKLPAIKKLDGMLLSMLDGFCDSEFYYVDRGVVVAGGVEEHLCSGRPSISIEEVEEKWWLPFPKVPPNGLSEDTRKRLQHCRECTTQIFKAAAAINSTVLSEMQIPNVYLRSLQKSGKACLGESLYCYLTAERFSPERVLDYLEMKSEFTTLEIANRVEAAAHIWSRKYLKRRLDETKAGSSSWGVTVKGLVCDAKRSKLLAERAETLLRSLKLRFPSLTQTALDMYKIQYNKDVGQSILESYSRVMESLAFKVLERIEDLLHVDDATQQRAAAE
ncbi:hypothetical protein RJ639_028608 [Escallonia herrerae]|uniref:PRONE domain-containing protein n=1 Tax=Escallonia herrerae TaxID=1293975 RepID=A0AA88X2U8_9ASTE|nr:hypothetical protein RJ639_028608 [Escallonia herrerae]